MKSASLSSSLLLSARAMQYASPSPSSSSSSSFSYTNNQSRIVMAKAKKKSKSSSSSSQGSKPNPQRITSNVKQNLQLLKTQKKVREGYIPRPTSSYRKKKLSKKEVLPEDEEIYLDTTTSLYYMDRELNFANGVPVLLIDGYNVCGYWDKLSKDFHAGRLDVARQKLIDDMITFKSIRAVKVVVVFDAMRSGLPTHKENFNGIDVVFSADMTADTWIEREVSVLRKDGGPTVWVVTSDRLQQETAFEAGAFIWSCRTLISEIEEAEIEVDMFYQEQRRIENSFDGHLLKHNLKPEVVEGLRNMRDKLIKNEFEVLRSLRNKVAKK